MTHRIVITTLVIESRLVVGCQGLRVGSLLGDLLVWFLS